MSDIKWETPPSSRGRGNRAVPAKYAAEAEQYRTRAGEWGVLMEYPVERRGAAQAVAFQIREGRYKAFRPVGEWQTTTRRVEDAIKVYVKYTGS